MAKLPSALASRYIFFHRQTDQSEDRHELLSSHAFTMGPNLAIAPGKVRVAGLLAALRKRSDKRPWLSASTRSDDQPCESVSTRCRHA